VIDVGVGRDHGIDLRGMKGEGECHALVFGDGRLRNNQERSYLRPSGALTAAYTTIKTSPWSRPGIGRSTTTSGEPAASSCITLMVNICG
jgi:hypothetical protein